MSKDLIAMLLEVGFPIIAILFVLFKPSTRKYLLPILGAITICLIAYLVVAIRYLFGNGDDIEFVFNAMWSMSFFVYCILILMGLVVAALLRKKSSNILRFFAGFTVSLLLVGVIMGTRV